MQRTIPLRENRSSLSLLIGEKKLHLHNSDITSLTADAIVCPVDRNLDFRSGIARVISQAAGKGIRVHRPTFPEPYGKVVVLPGGNMKAKYVFLTVLLGEKEQQKARQSIRQAVERTIKYAEFLRLKSIAFPVLGSLQNDMPYTHIAQEMLEEVIQYLQRRRTKIQTVFFSCFNHDAFKIFCTEAKTICNLSEES